jgi:hypothetical protein
MLIEAIGFLGTILTIGSYAMKSMVPLRVTALLSSVSFLAYGLVIQSYPVILMEIILLPLNTLRLRQAMRRFDTSAPAAARSGRRRFTVRGALAAPRAERVPVAETIETTSVAA